MTQIPLRAANALTTYSVQGKQFDRYCIYETHAAQFYTQISRGRQGLESVFISSNFNKKMNPSIRSNVITEMDRLKNQYMKTSRVFREYLSPTTSIHFESTSDDNMSISDSDSDSDSDIDSTSSNSDNSHSGSYDSSDVDSYTSSSSFSSSSSSSSSYDSDSDSD